MTDLLKNGWVRVALPATAVAIVVALSLRRRYSRRQKVTADELLSKILAHPSVRIRDKEIVRLKLQRLIDGGSEQLQIVTDFDRTMSRNFGPDGKKSPTSHRAVETVPELTEDKRAALERLNAHYYPLEVDPNLSNAEKLPLMNEWWSKAHEILIEAGLRRDTIRRSVYLSGIALKDNCDVMLRLLARHDVPTLVFSAGIGDVIEELISLTAPSNAATHSGTPALPVISSNPNEVIAREFPFLKIVSNFMDFNGQATLIGFRGDLIHTLNKTFARVINSDFYETHLRHRKNAVLLGDLLFDLRMLDGSSHVDCALTIGYYTEQLLPTNINNSRSTVQISGSASAFDYLEKYKENYDIVLVNDDTANLPLSIVRAIL